MDEKNKNISETFGKYNNGTDELRNVSSSMWEPISAGRSSAPASGKTPQKKSAPSAGKGKSSAASGRKKTPSGQKQKKTSAQKGGLISEGRPGDKKKASGKKQPVGKTQSAKEAVKTPSKKKSPPKKKTPPSRTPKGRDMRKDAKEQQKHREELFRSREDYQNKLKNQLNHDEISQLRNEDKRKKNVRSNAVTVGSVLLFALIFILIYCYSRGALIENVIIDGNTIYTAQEIQQAAGISAGRNMLSLREKRVRKDITSKLPYIKDVSMKYDLPDTLILTVSGTSDKYVIACQDKWLTLDSDGKIVSDVKGELKSGLYRADGFDYQPAGAGDVYRPEGMNEERFNLLKQFVALFEKDGIVESAVIDLKNTENVIVTIDGKIAVYFGDCKNLEEKVPYASLIIDEVRGQKGYIDMRFDPGAFKPGSMTIQ